MACATQTVGVKVLEALGLQTKGCLSLTLDFHPGDVVKATAVYAPDEAPLMAAIEVARTLVPRDDAAAADPA